MQRKMAFIFTLGGYFIAFIYAICTEAESELQVIYATYFLSVLLLSIVNFVFKKKASGHACSFVAPIIILFVDSLPWWAAIFLIIGGISVWSSLYLKRHQPKELFWGGCCSVMAIVLSVGIFGF